MQTHSQNETNILCLIYGEKLSETTTKLLQQQQLEVPLSAYRSIGRQLLYTIDNPTMQRYSVSFV